MIRKGRGALGRIAQIERHENLFVFREFELFGERVRIKEIEPAALDSGVFRAIRPKGPLDLPAEIDGAALEGLVFQQLRTWIDYRATGDTLSFWRTHTGQEVDFVIYGENRFDAIEVKNTARLSPKDFSGLKAFATDYPEARRILLYRGTDRLLRNDVLCIPVEEFLRTLTI